MANKTISDLRELSTVSDNNVLVVETNNETFKVTKENLLKEVNTQLNTKSNENHTHDEYVTESELNAKGLATESFVGSEISKIELTPGPQGPKGDKGDPGTTTWEGITNKPTNLATETFVTQKIAEASLSGGEVDLSGYATRDYVNEKITQVQVDAGFHTKILTIDEIAEIIGSTPNHPGDVPVTSITASTNYISINVGEKRKITYTVYPNNATDKTVTFESNNEDVCVVDQLGNIEALKQGEAMITLVASNGVSTDCQVIVSEVSQKIEVTQIKLSQTSLNINVGDKTTIKATIIPSEATNQSVIWESSNEDVATIENGVVFGKNDGNCYITCKSLSNPTVYAECSVNVKEVVALTTITRGLKHSYDFTNLSGSNTTIDDLTGNTPCLMTGFSDVAAAKTERGIKCGGSKNFIIQSNLLSDYNNEITVVATFIGQTDKSQGYYAINGIKLCRHLGGGISYTHSGYLKESFCRQNHNDDTYSTMISQFDFNNKIIKTYIDGSFVGEVAMDGKVVWGNELKLFDGYSDNNTHLLTVKNLCIYDRLLSDDECVKVSEDLVGKKRYTTLDFNKSTVTNKQGVIYQIGDESIERETNLTNIVSTKDEDSLTNVSLKNNEGFLVSDYASFSVQPNLFNTTIIKFKNNPSNNSKEQYLIYDKSSGVRMYIQNSKIYIRSNNNWFLDGASVQINEGYNIIRIENNKLYNTFTVYLNGSQLQTTKKDTSLGVESLYNTTLLIKDFIVIDKFLSENELSQLSSDLGGVL